MKIAKYDSGRQGDSQIGPQLVTWANSTSTTTFTALGGVGGTPTDTAPRTIQVHYKTAAGVLKNDGFIVRQRGRKVFDVQSVSGGVATKTRCKLVESGTLSASQMYITFGYDGGGTQYASRISNRYVWTASDTVRHQYTCGLSAEVAFIQGTSGVVFYNSNGDAYPIALAVVESAD